MKLLTAQVLQATGYTDHLEPILFPAIEDLQDLIVAHLQRHSKDDAGSEQTSRRPSLRPRSLSSSQHLTLKESPYRLTKRKRLSSKAGIAKSPALIIDSSDNESLDEETPNDRIRKGKSNKDDIPPNKLLGDEVPGDDASQDETSADEGPDERPDERPRDEPATGTRHLQAAAGLDDSQSLHPERPAQASHPSSATAVVLYRPQTYPVHEIISLGPWHLSSASLAELSRQFTDLLVSQSFVAKIRSKEILVSLDRQQAAQISHIFFGSFFYNARETVFRLVLESDALKDITSTQEAVFSKTAPGIVQRLGESLAQTNFGQEYPFHQEIFQRLHMVEFRTTWEEVKALVTSGPDNDVKLWVEEQYLAIRTVEVGGDTKHKPGQGKALSKAKLVISNYFGISTDTFQGMIRDAELPSMLCTTWGRGALCFFPRRLSSFRTKIRYQSIIPQIIKAIPEIGTAAGKTFESVASELENVVECAHSLFTNKAYTPRAPSHPTEADGLVPELLPSYTLLQVLDWFGIRYGRRTPLQGQSRMLNDAGHEDVSPRHREVLPGGRGTSAGSIQGEAGPPHRDRAVSQPEDVVRHRMRTIHPETLYGDML
ncbi:hypothetical protein CSIM01_13852 [Colletotrichum simmondsii]|uniref:Uncharacterized protein n=1 Tax=Colletotrichum simmondsii TaxID=703756 RepID=A0A135TZH0_9PEZI|nr:hypothetical protein CSIM01_13852 [Colletotrichum simmondsii]